MNAKYKKYLGSKEWKGRKERWFSTYPNSKCKACGTGNKIILHHLSYKRIGRERDSDLMPLCNSCHMKLHNYARKQRRKSLYQSSMEYVASVSKVKDPNSLSQKLSLLKSRSNLRKRS